MKHDEKCRPGNLILGGGGRGILVAPSEYGTGNWKVLREAGDIVGEVWVRDGDPVGSKNHSRQNSGLGGIVRRFTDKSKTGTVGSNGTNGTNGEKN